MAELYPYQEQAVKELLNDKYIATIPMGGGKSIIAMKWAAEKCKQLKQHKVIIVTTAAKSRRVEEFEQDADEFILGWRKYIKNLQCLSWHKLKKWVLENRGHLGEYIYIFDEVARAKNYSTGMGWAFLAIAKATSNWTGYTGTPGDNWLHFLPYFVATKQVRNKTSYLYDYAIVQTYKGFPEITEWVHTNELQKMWDSIATAPDTSAVLSQLPAKQHKVLTFKKPPQYDKVRRTRTTTEGEFMESVMEVCHYLRQQCFTKEKQQWLSDFFTDMDDGVVVFYSYVEEGDTIAELAKKAGRKVWRIDGKHHEIPTAETIGDRDVVLCQWQSGSEALNLQFLHYWISVSPSYSYSTSVQARGRVDRIGQTHPITYWYLKTVGTIEEDVYKALATKSSFSEDVWFNNNYKEGEK